MTVLVLCLGGYRRCVVVVVVVRSFVSGARNFGVHCLVGGSGLARYNNLGFVLFMDDSITRLALFSLARGYLPGNACTVVPVARWVNNLSGGEQRATG
jgi:hypothetical protein